MIWEDVLRVTLVDAGHAGPRYQVEYDDPDAHAIVEAFWRVFRAIRV